jgi:hypothetical protein
MSPFKVLGLTRRASLVEVKRAYAQLLKKHRPDEDPVGFQRIHEAFEACVARCRERDAREREQALALAARGPGEDGDEAGDDGRGDDDAADDYADDGAGPGTPCLLQLGGDDYALDRPGPAARVGSAAPDELVTLHEELLARMHRDSPQALEAWLSRDERLYAPSRKRALCARLLADAHALEPLDWRVLEAVFRFFELDSISDPRLADDYFARRLWLRVREDERFHAKLDALREGRHDTAVDRALLHELLDPPNRARTLLLLAVPGLANRLRLRHDELAAADAVRTEAVVAPRMHSLWLPLTDPSRLDWRRFAVVYLQAAVLIAAVLALFVLAAGNDLAKYLRITTITWTIFAVPWTGWTLVRWGWRNYVDWQVGAYGEGDAPAGAPLFADRLSVLVLVILGCVLLTWALLWRLGGQGFGALLHIAALVISLRMIAGDSARFRAESYLLCASTGALAWGLLTMLPAAGERWDFGFFIPAFSIGTILVVLADHLEARWRHVTPGEARNRLGRIHLLAAAAAALGVYAIVASA